MYVSKEFQGEEIEHFAENVCIYIHQGCLIDL